MLLFVAFTSGDMLAAISKRAGAARSSEQVLRDGRRWSVWECEYGGEGRG